MSPASFAVVRPRICRECLRGLQSLIRSRSIHHTSKRLATEAAKFDSFFSRNEAWSKTGAFGTAPKSSATAEENWPSYAQPLPDSTHREGISDAYPPPETSVTYRPIPELTLKRRLKLYAQLSKSRLTALIVLTAMSSVAVSPVSVSVPVLLATAAGTTLCAASANARYSAFPV